MTSWERLLDLKEFHSVQTAEYAKTLGINHEPAFNRWVPHILRKHDRILLLVKSWNVCYLKWTHKFGLDFLKDMAKALKLTGKVR